MMNIYFSANHRNISRDLTDYHRIITTLQKQGHILLNNWTDTAYGQRANLGRHDDWASVCVAAQAGIEDADLLVVEASGESGFGVGFEVATALSLGKKMLILVREDEENNSYASGLDRQAIRYRAYNVVNVEKVIQEALVW